MTRWRTPGNSALALIAILSVLAVVFGVLLSALLAYEQSQDKAEAETILAREAAATGMFIRDAVLRSDYQNIQVFVDDWARRSPDLVALSIRAPNGFAIAGLRRDTEAITTVKVSHPVRHDGRTVAVVDMVRDLRPWVQARYDQRVRLVPLVMGFVLILALVLWWSLRRLILIPMEKTDTRLADTARELAARNRDLGGALVRAEEANRSKSQFLAAMSHELRTPLNAIIGFSDMMRHETIGRLGSDRYREYATSINDSGQHLLELINDVLDVAKIESGSMALHLEEVPLHKPIHAAVRMVRDQAIGRGVQLSVALSEHAPVLEMDERRAKQIFLNLLSNAVKFTEPGGRVDVTVDAAAPDGGVNVTVRDTGIGMSADEVDTALTAFGQADSDLNRRYTGTGLGLPLAKELAELHGATLTVESEPGTGTAVTVRWPDSLIRGEALVSEDGVTAYLSA